MKRLLLAFILAASIKQTLGRPLPLPNVGGCSCYVNTTIQNLFSIESLTNTLLESSTLYPVNSLVGSYIQLTRQLKDAEAALVQKRALERSVSARYKRSLEAFYNNVTAEFGEIRQQDPTEFLVRFLDNFFPVDASESTIERIQAVMSPFFTSRLQSTIYCSNNDLPSDCQDLYPEGYRSERIEPYNMLTLEVVGNSLLDCLAAFFGEETLEEFRPADCPTSLQNVCRKQLRIQRSSDILIVALKRFRNGELARQADELSRQLAQLSRQITEQKKDTTQQGKQRLKERAIERIAISKQHSAVSNARKISTYIDVPLELDLDPWTISDDEDTSYQLIGVMTHLGGVESGHYTAYVKSRGSWWYCNDEFIRQLAGPEKLHVDETLSFSVPTLAGARKRRVRRAEKREMPRYAIGNGYVFIYQRTSSLQPEKVELAPETPEPIQDLETALNFLTAALIDLRGVLG